MRVSTDCARAGVASKAHAAVPASRRCLVTDVLLSWCSVCPHHRRRLPRAVEDAFLAPVGADVEREVSVRRREPVGFLLAARRFRAGMERERTVGIALESLVLGAERVALEVVRMEQMLVVVQGQ